MDSGCFVIWVGGMGCVRMCLLLGTVLTLGGNLGRLRRGKEEHGRFLHEAETNKSYNGDQYLHGKIRRPDRPFILCKI